MPELLSRLADAKLPETWHVPAWAIFEPADGSGPGFVAFHFQSWDEKRGEHAPPEVVIRDPLARQMTRFTMQTSGEG